MEIKLIPATDVDEIMNDDKARAAKAITATMRVAGELIKGRARAAIAAGGFSGRWQNALRVKNYPESGVSSSAAVFVYHKIPYAGQFEQPKPVVGSPLLWMPILANLPGGRRWTPALFTRTMGPLRGGRNGGRPILFGQVSVSGGGRVAKYPKSLKAVRRYNAAKTSVKWLPVFIGVKQVNDPQRFDTGAVVQAVGGQLAEIYSNNWDGSDG